MNSKENFIIDKPYSLQPEDEQAISNVQNKGLTVHSWSDKELDSLKQNTAMKNNKSQLDIFLLKRIEENREELRHNLDSTLQVEQACLEEIVKGIKHCKTNITQCNKVLDKASLTYTDIDRHIYG